jgi:hypothetical protein
MDMEMKLCFFQTSAADGNEVMLLPSVVTIRDTWVYSAKVKSVPQKIILAL